MAVSTNPAGGQPASNPLVNHLGSRACWLVGSGRPKDPSKPNGEPLKAPCDRNGYPLKAWDTVQPVTYAQAAAWIRPPHVRFIGIRSSAAGDVAGLDLDDVLNAGMGCIDSVAWHIWARYPTYTEVTPSGRGLRMWWIVKGDAQPVSIKTERDRKTGLSEVAVTVGVFNDKTCTVEPQTFNIGRELYYRADRFLIVTSNPYVWLANGRPDPLRTITAAQLQEIASLVKARRPPAELVETENADTTADMVQIGATMTTTADMVQIGATMTTTQDHAVVVNIPQSLQGFYKDYAQAQLDHEVAQIAGTKEGGRNDALNKAAYQLGGLVKHGLLDEATITRELTAAAIKAGLGAREAQATIKSGLNKGIDKPRQLPRPPQQGRAAGVNMQSMRDRINTRRAITINGVQK